MRIPLVAPTPVPTISADGKPPNSGQKEGVNGVTLLAALQEFEVQQDVMAERLEASVVEAPGRVQVHVPFAAKIAVRNLDPVKPVTSLFVVLSTYLDSSVRCVGQSGRFLPQIPAGESVDVAFDLIALKPGIQKIGPLVFFDDKGKVEYGKPARAHGGRTEPNAPRALFYPAHTGCKRVKMC